ncbi:MAG: hypothetical protein ABF976_08380 [Acetobacter syzygii]|uniref:hypothetical protein n=1 Tax=Acetobacter syzygii TaxID=146476 RepID=UPI0039EC5479
MAHCCCITQDALPLGRRGGGGESGIGARHATAGFFDGAHAPVAFAHQGYWNA